MTLEELFAEYPDRLDRTTTAQMLGKSTRAVDHMIRTGKLHAYKVGNTVLILKSDVLAMIEPVGGAR